MEMFTPSPISPSLPRACIQYMQPQWKCSPPPQSPPVSHEHASNTCNPNGNVHPIPNHPQSPTSMHPIHATPMEMSTPSPTTPSLPRACIQYMQPQWKCPPHPQPPPVSHEHASNTCNPNGNVHPIPN